MLLGAETLPDKPQPSQAPGDHPLFLVNADQEHSYSHRTAYDTGPQDDDNGKQEHDSFPFQTLRFWGLESGLEELSARGPPNTQGNRVSSTSLPQHIRLISFPRINGIT